MVDIGSPAGSLLGLDWLLKPIPGDCPSGPSLRYTPAYDEIREALRPLDTAPGGVWQRTQKPTDFPAVIKMASDQLATRSKDLDIAVWLTAALVGAHGIPGLTEGLILIRRLLEDFWETVYPVIDQDGDQGFRAKPINHLNKAFVGAVQQLPITADGRTVYDYNTSRSEGAPDEVDRSIQATPAQFYDALLEEVGCAREAIGRLQATCLKSFKDADRPYLEKLLNQMEGLHNVVTALRRAKPSAAPMETFPVRPKSGAAPGPEAAPNPGPKPPEPPVEPKIEDRGIFGIAASLRRDDPSNPVPYMLLRSWAFGPLMARGTPVDPDQLQPPSTELRTALRRGAQREDWWDVLEQTEHAMESACGGCWLDIQQYSYNACNRLGFTAAANGIRGLVAGCVQALPDLAKAIMLDGSQTASPDTFAWLRTEVLVDAQTMRKESLDEVRPVDFVKQTELFDGKEPDAFEVAESELNSGRFDQAFRVLANALSRELTGRGRMQRKVQLAKICMEAGQNQIALPILRETFQLIENRCLHNWEALELIAPPLAMLYRCLDGVKDSAEYRQRVYERLCGLDPLRALELTAEL